jgi:uncharacterized repeat protein (TIGR01451 family)
MLPWHMDRKPGAQNGFSLIHDETKKIEGVIMRGHIQPWSVGLSAVVCFLTVGLIGGMAFEAFADIANLPSGFTATTCVSGVQTPNKLTIAPDGSLVIVDYDTTAAIGDPDTTPDYIWKSSPPCDPINPPPPLLTLIRVSDPGLGGVAFSSDGTKMFFTVSTGSGLGTLDGEIRVSSPPGAVPTLLKGGLNQPFGLALAPSCFGSFANMLIIADPEKGGTDDKGQIYAIDQSGGGPIPVTARETLLKLPLDLSFSPDCYLYVAVNAGIVRVDSSGNVSLVASLANAFALTAHPLTGDLYVVARVSTNPHEHEIKKINPSTGAMTTFATAYGASDLEAEEVGGGGGGLVFSPDGKTLYVSEPGNDQVVKITGSFGPTITNIGPDSSAVHTPVTITGSNFGSTQGSSTVMFNGLSAQVISWSDTSIQVRVPLIATPNGNSTPADVKVTVGGVDWNTQSFTVIRGIVFDSNRSGNFEIWVMNPDGSGQSKVTNNPDVFDSDSYCYGWTTSSLCDIIPTWSPDGTKIAFNSTRDGNFEVYVINADGTGEMNLTNNPADDGSVIAWSPDGTKIAFSTNRDGGSNYEVYVMNIDGSNLVNLTNNPAGDTTADWSPDGTKLIFRTTRDGNAEIYVMNIDGSNQTNLTNNLSNEGMGHPRYSPDGSRILFASDRDGNFEEYVMNANGSGQTRLTNNSAREPGQQAWSPDGTKIVFSRGPEDQEELYMMNADGSGQIRITNNAFNDRYPAWASGSSISPPTTFTLTVGSTGTGSGTITATGIDCGLDCSEQYNSNTVVTLTATADTNSVFAGWSDCLTSTSSPINVTIDADKTCTATFNLVNRTLTVAGAGTGVGTVTATNVNCSINVGVTSNDCTDTVPHDSTIILAATTLANSQFAGWVNCDSPSGAQCTMTMNADKTVTATFNLTPANITATKEDSDPNGSPYKPGDTIKYTVVLSNTGGAALNNGPGDEFTDTITSVATLNAAGTASSGTLTINPSIKKVTWNGAIPAGSSVTLTFSVRIPMGVIGTQRFCNQGTAKDGNGGSVLTIDPTPLSGAGTQTCVDVVGRPDLGIPLTLQGIEVLFVRDRIYFNALGTGIKEINVQVFSLAGKRVYASNWVENGHEWSLQNTAGRRVANGIYLYVMSVKGYDGQIRTQVKKLIIRR